MAFGMRFASLALAISTRALATAYTRLENKNAFRDQFGHKGGDHLEHCEHLRTLDECKHLCDMDCECHCLTVYMGTDTEYEGNTTKPCFRRHSCDTSTMESNDAFDVYTKDGASSTCSLFEDFGFENKCVGGSAPKTATNVGSLEECKAICELLSFECKGIEYLSKCSDTSADTCVIYTGGEITGGQGHAPVKLNDVNDETHHCLKYTGPVGNLSGGLIVPVHFHVNGVDSGALLGSSSAVDAVGQKIKDAFAAQSALINASLVQVVLEESGAHNVTATVAVELQAATDFHDVRQALRDNVATLEAEVSAQLTTLNGTLSLGSGPFSMSDVEFNLTQAEFLTTTVTSTTMSRNDTGDDETTTTANIQVSGTRQIGTLGALLMWLAAACYPQA